MRDRTNGSPAMPAEFVRARRFELVDDAGQVRAVLGNLAHDSHAAYWPSLTLRNAHGRDRVWLAVHDFGPQLAFDLGGNTVAILQVDDPQAGSSEPGVHLTVCDADGAPVFGWHVSLEGDVDFEGPTSECNRAEARPKPGSERAG